MISPRRDPEAAKRKVDAIRREAKLQGWADERLDALEKTLEDSDEIGSVREMYIEILGRERRLGQYFVNREASMRRAHGVLGEIARES